MFLSMLLFASKIQYDNRNAHRDVGVNFGEFTEEMQNEESTENAVAIPMPILDEINQDVQTGTTGSYMTAVQVAVKLLDWGTGTGLDPQEITMAKP